MRFGLEWIMEQATRAERLAGHLERRQSGQHVANSFKEWLLASRSVIDSILDTLEEEQQQQSPAARKIKIIED